MPFARPFPVAFNDTTSNKNDRALIKRHAVAARRVARYIVSPKGRRLAMRHGHAPRPAAEAAWDHYFVRADEVHCRAAAEAMEIADGRGCERAILLFSLCAIHMEWRMLREEYQVAHDSLIDLLLARPDDKSRAEAFATSGTCRAAHPTMPRAGYH